ncbi:hypothetical protein D3C86_1470810 [compost metagenome]
MVGVGAQSRRSECPRRGERTLSVDIADGVSAYGQAAIGTANDGSRNKDTPFHKIIHLGIQRQILNNAPVVVVDSVVSIAKSNIARAPSTTESRAAFHADVSDIGAQNGTAFDAIAYLQTPTLTVR